MDENRIKLVSDIVYQYATMAGINDLNACSNTINYLCTLDVNDCIDKILVSLSNQINYNHLTKEQVLSKLDLILLLNPDKYKTTNDLINRLSWIKSMNIENTEMPLEENHKVVLEIFDKFNELMGRKFDSFYTGGLMGYIMTDHKLERYHSDLDLFINEEELLELYNLIEQSDDFQLVSNMNSKEETGHEFKITYKSSPVSIGLFLFGRLENGEIVIKNYFYQNQDKTNNLILNETHLSKEYSSITFQNNPRMHNNKYYKSQSLETIYQSKKSSRPKDRYDAKAIEDFVDLKTVNTLERLKNKNYTIYNIVVSDSIIRKLDEKLSSSNGVTL